MNVCVNADWTLMAARWPTQRAVWLLCRESQPSSAILLSSSHQRWWKAGPRPSTMTGWRGARNSSPWLRTCRPKAGGWQGAGFEGLMNGFWHHTSNCACACVCVHTGCLSGPPSAWSELQEEPKERLLLAPVTSEMRRAALGLLIPNNWLQLTAHRTHTST